MKTKLIAVAVLFGGSMFAQGFPRAVAPPCPAPEYARYDQRGYDYSSRGFDRDRDDHSDRDNRFDRDREHSRNFDRDRDHDGGRDRDRDRR